MRQRALDAIQSGEPVPRDYVLPALTPETSMMFDRLRKGEPRSHIAKVELMYLWFRHSWLQSFKKSYHIIKVLNNHRMTYDIIVSALLKNVS